MRHVLVSVLLTFALLLAGTAAPPGAHAGAPDWPKRLRDAKRREDDLRRQLQAALLWAETNQMRAERLMVFAEDLLKRRASTAAPADPALAALKAQNAALREEVAALQADLSAEQQRHVEDVTALQRELARANANLEKGRLQLVRAQDAGILAEHRRRERAQEVERLQWIQARSMPRESVARVLTNIPASHWRAELRADEATRARVALQVLAVLPAPSAEAIDAILFAAHRDGSLYDAALAPLVRIGTPAVQPLVAAACGEHPERTLDRGWVMHVLGSMGAAAQDALPWLEELAAGEGREAAQAQGAIRRIRGG